MRAAVRREGICSGKSASTPYGCTPCSCATVISGLHEMQWAGVLRSRPRRSPTVAPRLLRARTSPRCGAHPHMPMACNRAVVLHVVRGWGRQAAPQPRTPQGELGLQGVQSTLQRPAAAPLAPLWLVAVELLPTTCSTCQRQVGTLARAWWGGAVRAPNTDGVRRQGLIASAGAHA